MDFIEHLTGLAPDGGNGTLEAVLLIVCLLAVPLLRVICIVRQAGPAWLRYELPDRD